MIYVSAIFNFQFLDPLKTEKLSHAADCSIVGKAKLPLSCIFPFIVDRIEVKIWFMFQHSFENSLEKKVKFSIWHFRIFYDKK